jgi:hypothetical protein
MIRFSAQRPSSSPNTGPTNPQPTTLPDGTVIDPVADDEGDDLTIEERRALHETLSASWKSTEAGALRPTSAILDELRRRR